MKVIANFFITLYFHYIFLFFHFSFAISFLLTFVIFNIEKFYSTLGNVAIQIHLVSDCFCILDISLINV